ncbi:MAG: peptide chain release factor 1 [Rhodospirillales bacterium]|nr:peptide chain release factor 1 [Rhodospirillales bacterium]MSP80496.1 peptide chain release factor 1 [Rhodospirillales bacterium]
MSLDEKLSRVVARRDELAHLMAAGDAGRDFPRLAKEYADLGPVVEALAGLDKARVEAAGLKNMMDDAGVDAEMRKLAESEYFALKGTIVAMEKRVQFLLIPRDEADEKSAIIEVRAGTGGDEAALFAAALFRMYQRYADRRGWKFSPIEMSDTGLGGLKEGIAEIVGPGVFARLKFESGVHRVQRVPTTEASGRIHTSAATVAVLPEAEEVDIKIEDKDLRVDTYRSQGAGGQHVNTTESAVRITHLPSGVAVACQEEKSQHKNKAKAMKLLRSRLYEHERAKNAASRAADRKSQIGTGDRSERIRTYNFPQGRVTDHRINLTLHKLDRILEGEIDEFVEALIADDQAARLAEIT